MTLNYFALLPKYCDKCKRRFIFEKYHKRSRLVGIEQYPLEYYVCDKCARKEENENVHN